MNIALVNNQDINGGAETVMWQLHHGLLASGHHSTVYVDEYDWRLPLPDRRGLYHELLHRLDHSRFHNFVQSMAPRGRLTDRAFRSLAHSPHQVIHIHNFHGIYASIESLAYLASRKPVVWTFHRFWGITGGCDHPGECHRYMDACGNCPRVNEWPINGVDNTAEQLALKLQHFTNSPLPIIAPSKHLAHKVAESRVGRQWQIMHIPNGVNPRSFGFERKHDPQFRRLLGIDPDAIAVLVVNRNFKDPVKGYQAIKTALARLKPNKAQFIFVGEYSAWAIGNLEGNLSCVDMGYVSSRQRMAELYEAADIFLYSSPGENFPCAILEAMSAKCCVVSTPTDGVIEQVQNNVSGVLSSSFSGEDLAKALEFALASPEKCRAFADAARQRVEAEFSERQMIDAHLALYRKLISTT